MYRQMLFLIVAGFLFTNFQCLEECEGVFIDGGAGGELVVELSDSGETYAINDVFELTARFSAVLETPRGLTYTISENGGLIITELYRITPDTSALEPALEAFVVETLEGELLPAPEEDEFDAVLRTRYLCPGQTCTFRQSFRALSAGSFVLRVTGGSIDEIQAGFNYCEAPNLSSTTLSGGGNPGPSSSSERFTTPYNDGFWPFYNPLINPDGARNVYFFTVE